MMRFNETSQNLPQTTTSKALQFSAESYTNLLDNYLDAWLNSAEISPSTRNTYRRGMDQFSDWIIDNRHPIATQTIRQWREMLREQYSVATTNVLLSSVRSFFGWCVEMGILEHNPAAGVKGASRRGQTQKHKRDELTSSEMRRVMGIIDNDDPGGKRDYAMVMLMAFAALRQIEVQRSDIGDIKTRGGRRVLWIQGKGHVEKDDFVVLPPPVEESLNDWLKHHPNKKEKTAPLFCSLSRRNFAGRMTTRSIRRVVKKAFDLAGVVGDGKTTHSLRHSAITSAIRAGAPITSVQAMARHVNINTTMIYYHEAERTSNPAEDWIDYGN